jgi:hypothetical protein
MMMKQIYRNCHGDETDLQKKQIPTEIVMVMKQIYRNCHGDETDLQKLSW